MIRIGTAGWKYKDWDGIVYPKPKPRGFNELEYLAQYFTAGVKEVWLINPADLTAEIWTGPNLPAPALSGQDSLTSALLPGFTMPLPDLFS